jgi:nucleoside-diphosphate-sugar epimerase
MKLSVTGFSGFVGSNLISFFDTSNFEIEKINCRAINFNEFHINSDVFIHLAGIAHDLKKNYNNENYYRINFELTCKLFDKFLESDCKTFIFMSSVKAVADFYANDLDESEIPKPNSDYGKSKLFAENYILNKKVINKKIFILRPCMIHGPGNKGNLNLLYKFVQKKIPWPLTLYENKRSYCSIDNMCFVISELINRNDIPSGIYNVADNGSLSTNEIISLIAKLINIKIIFLKLPKVLVKFIFKIGDIMYLKFNTKTLEKLTNNYTVSNVKLKNAINKEFPVTIYEGLRKTIKSLKD